MPRSPWNEGGDSGPPRSIEPALRLRLCLEGVLGQVSFGLLAFGLLFAQIFGQWVDFDSFWVFRGELAQATGVVESSEYSNIDVNDQTMVRTRFQWGLEGAEPFSDVSWGTRVYTPGESVALEVASSDPARARIAGQRSSPMPLWTVLPIAPWGLVGLALSAVAIVRGLRRARLLRDGLLAEGQFERKRATNTTINNRRVIALTYTYEDESGATQECVAKTHKPELLSEDEPEPLIYDPTRPERALLLNALQGRPTITTRGVEAGRHGSLLFLVLPAIALLANTTAFLVIQLL